MSEKPDNSFKMATQPEMLKQREKDNEYKLITTQKFFEALEILTPKMISYRTFSDHQDSLKLGATLLYYFITTLRGNQTLGEEYSSILQFNSKDWDNDFLPMKLSRRIGIIFLSCIPLYLLNKFVCKWYENKRDLAISNNSKDFKNIFWSSLPNFENLIENTQKFHLAIFFLQGIYLDLSKRFSFTNYIFTHNPRPHSISYKKIGLLMIIQMTFQSFGFLIKLIQKYKKSKENNFKNPSPKLNEKFINEENLENVNENDLCGLCYDKRKESSVTPCGHLFCWECIIKACITKEECPQCRQTCPARKIIRLRNFN